MTMYFSHLALELRAKPKALSANTDITFRLLVRVKQSMANTRWRQQMTY